MTDAGVGFFAGGREGVRGQQTELGDSFWLDGIIFITVRNSLAKSTAFFEECAHSLHDGAAKARLPCRRIVPGELRTSLEPALCTLPPRIAKVFRLYAIEERSNREVCAEVNIS